MADAGEPTPREMPAPVLADDSSNPTQMMPDEAVAALMPGKAEGQVEDEEEEDDEEPLPGHQRLHATLRGTGRQRAGLDILCVTEALLGKHRDCEVVCRAFPTPEQDAITHGVSRQHARLRVASGKLFVEDLGSLNGTFLDDKRLGAGPIPLHDEARLRLGPVLTLEVRLFKSGAALLRRMDPYHGDFPPTLMLWDKLPLGEPLLGLVPPTGDSVTRWGVMQNSRPNGDLWWGGPKAVRWDRDGDSPPRPQALQPGDLLVMGNVTIAWGGDAKPGLG